MSGLNLQWLFPCFQGALLGLLAMVLHEVGHLVAAMAPRDKGEGSGSLLEGTLHGTRSRAAGEEYSDLFCRSVDQSSALFLVASFAYLQFGKLVLCCMQPVANPQFGR